uniref:Putative secreted protein n=1 Tax=Anopheles darlingi TaxID=43151 RepID=A0A2M4D8S9_ANODA
MRRMHTASQCETAVSTILFLIISLRFSFESTPASAKSSTLTTASVFCTVNNSSEDTATSGELSNEGGSRAFVSARVLEGCATSIVSSELLFEFRYTASPLSGFSSFVNIRPLPLRYSAATPSSSCWFPFSCRSPMTSGTSRVSEQFACSSFERCSVWSHSLVDSSGASLTLCKGICGEWQKSRSSLSSSAATVIANEARCAMLTVCRVHSNIPLMASNRSVLPAFGVVKSKNVVSLEFLTLETHIVLPPTDCVNRSDRTFSGALLSAVEISDVLRSSLS